MDALRITLANGGGTFGPDGGMVNPATGYAVGMVADTFATLPADVSAEDFRAVLATLRQAHPAAYIGTWLDSGRIHVDPVTLVTDRDAAMTLGRQHGQLAVYDFRTGEAVTLA